MKSIRSRKSASGASTFPSSSCRPSPRAHHSFEWKPFPEKSTASRTGASPAFALPRGSSAQTRSDSSQGRAMLTPRPRSIVRRENLVWVMGDSRDFRVLRSLVIVRGFQSTDLAKLPAADDRLEERSQAISIRFQALPHLVEERLIGKLHRPAQGIAQELTAELPEERVAPRLEEIPEQAVEPLEPGAVHGHRAGVDRPAAQVLLAPPPDRVEALEREAEGVDALVTEGALRVAGMLLHQLADGQALGRGLVLRELRNPLRRARQAFPEEHLADPVAAQDGTGARGPGLLGEGCGLGEHSAAREPLHPLDAPPLAAAHPGDPVVLRQLLVEEGVVRIQDFQNRSVALEEVGEEPDRLLVHRAAEGGEGGEVPFALLLQVIEVLDHQPPAGELDRQPPDLLVAEHPPQLRHQDLRFAEPPGRRRAAELLVGLGRPEEVAQPA